MRSELAAYPSKILLVISNFKSTAFLPAIQISAWYRVAFGNPLMKAHFVSHLQMVYNGLRFFRLILIKSLVRGSLRTRANYDQAFVQRKKCLNNNIKKLRY